MCVCVQLSVRDTFVDDRLSEDENQRVKAKRDIEIWNEKEMRSDTVSVVPKESFFCEGRRRQCFCHWSSVPCHKS